MTSESQEPLELPNDLSLEIKPLLTSEETLRLYEERELSEPLKLRLKELITSTKYKTISVDAVTNPIWKDTPLEIIKLKSYTLYLVLQLTVPAVSFKNLIIIKFSHLNELLDELDKTEQLPLESDNYYFELRVITEMMLFYYKGLDGLKFLLGNKRDRSSLVRKLYKGFESYLASKGRSLTGIRGNWRAIIDLAKRTDTRPPTSWDRGIRTVIYGIDFPRYQGVELRFQDIPTLLQPYTSLELSVYPLMVITQDAETGQSLRSCLHNTPRWDNIFDITTFDVDLDNIKGSMKTKEVYKSIYKELNEVSYSDYSENTPKETSEPSSPLEDFNLPRDSSQVKFQSDPGPSTSYHSVSNCYQQSDLVHRDDSGVIWKNAIFQLTGWLKSHGILCPELCLKMNPKSSDEAYLFLTQLFTLGQTSTLYNKSEAPTDESFQRIHVSRSPTRVSVNEHRFYRDQANLMNKPKSRTRSISLVKVRRGMKSITNTHIENLINAARDQAYQFTEQSVQDHCPILEPVRRLYLKGLHYAGFYSLKNHGIKKALANILNLRDEYCNSISLKSQALKILAHEHLWGIMPWTDIYYLKETLLPQSKKITPRALLEVVNSYYSVKSKTVKKLEQLEGLVSIFDDLSKKAIQTALRE